MIDKEQMIKSLMMLTPSWIGTGITALLSNTDTMITIIAGSVTIGFTIYKWVCDVKDRKRKKEAGLL